VPVVIKEVTPQKMLELALIENIQRADLNPIEEALAYQSLIEEYGLTQEMVARQVSKDRSTITNALRLLQLAPKVREALINAVAHRDYRLSGRRIEVRMFDDRLEVYSPGGLAGYITIDNIVEEHFSRNPRLVHGLFQWGYIEELGLGVDKMIDDMLAAGHPLGLFVEGHRSESGQLIRGRPGVAYLALRSGAPIVPLAVSGTRGARLGRFWRRDILFRVGPQFRAGDLGVKPDDPQVVVDAIMRRIAALMPPEQRGVYR